MGTIALGFGGLFPTNGTAAPQEMGSATPDSFATTPERVVVLNWDLLEQVLELGVTPVGAPNLEGYKNWVVIPKLPDSIQDIGTRAEPNLEKITQLKPDVILAASPQKDLLEVLERIAPVVYLPNFREQDQAGPVALEHFRTLATLLARKETAQKKIQAMTDRFRELKTQLSQAFPAPIRVVPMRFSSTTSVFIYSRNSTAQYVLEQLGLTAALPLPPTPWGIAQKRLKDLQHITDAYVLYVLPFPDEKKLKQSVLWRAMPFVHKGHVNSVRPVWNYGGAMSLLYMAEEFTRSLMKMVPEQ